MLKAYIRKSDGRDLPVQWGHTGQHVGVSDGTVRVARLYWSQMDAGPDEQAALDLLLSTVALLDTLVLTRRDADGVERVVLHGLVHEVGGDGTTVSLVAADNPQVQRLFDQPFKPGALLMPSDKAPLLAAAPVAPPVPPSGFPTMAQPVVPAAQSVDPAARPGGHPAAPPAAPPAGQLGGQLGGGGWVPSGRLMPQPTAV